MAENIPLTEEPSRTENNITEVLKEVKQAVMDNEIETLQNMMKRFGKYKETSSNPKS